MRRHLIAAFMFSVIIAISFSKLCAAEPADAVSGIWTRYLSEAEQVALTELMAGMSGGPSESDDDVTTSQAKLVALREWYETIAADIAPPLADIKTEPVAENGIHGLWFKPDNATPDKVLLYFHGGGYILGSPVTAAAISGFLAKEAGILCFSLDYPLAPESPFPAALDNALDAYRMLLDKGFKPEHIVFAGDSAGGGLALALLVDIREKSLPMPAGAYLLSPWTDLTHSFASHETKRVADSVVALSALELMASMYVGDTDRKSARISPAFAGLHGLPPLLIHVGSSEILLDDSLIVARNAATADVPVALMVWPGYGHVFQMMHGRLEGARKALQDGAVFFGEVLGKTLLRPHDVKE